MGTETSLTMIESQQEQLADITTLLTVIIIGIGCLIGCALYRVVRGAWEV